MCRPERSACSAPNTSSEPRAKGPDRQELLSDKERKTQAEAYAFHPGVAIFAIGDGSVRPIAEDISIREFARLVTRGGNEPTFDF